MILYPDNMSHIEGEQIVGPEKKADAAKWLATQRNNRASDYSYRAYDDGNYARPQLQWAQRSFVQPQAMMEDRYLYDPVEMRYTIDRYLDDLEQRYGGIDSVLLWAMYPNIGIDDRNQFDCVRDLPGGIEGVRKMVADFHRRGVRVLMPIKPWDIGTRDEGKPMWQAWAELAKALDLDGLNGDTLMGVPERFFQAADALGHPLVLEPEGGVKGEEPALAWNVMTWGYWKHPFVPTISKYKWLEPRHMVHLCQRWCRDKTHELQAAFFNGVGIESWENVWGIWNGITPRDGETLRRIVTIQRAMADLLISRDWEPHTAGVLQEGVFGTKFPSPTRTLWAIVNRLETSVSGEQLRVPHAPGTRYYDLWRGLAAQPRIDNGQATFAFDIEPFGYGAILATTDAAPDAALQKLLTRMKHLSDKPLSAYANQWRFLPQQIVPIAPTQPARTAPDGMIAIPATDAFDFGVCGIMIEGGNDAGVGVQYPWEDSPRRHHSHRMPIRAFYIDRCPVTNARFKQFLDASGYRPKDDHNFLKHWTNGQIPQGADNQPVVWVSLEDARAYAAWAGKRLPHEWEWQYAAQGTDGRIYPWGNDWDDSRVPARQSGRITGCPDNVDAHPSGASPFGVLDMVANVWQWTEEFTDEHTRAATLRGGSFYRPSGSHWYFPQAHRLDQHGKYLLLAPCKDRCGTVGFRCVMDRQ